MKITRSKFILLTIIAIIAIAWCATIFKFSAMNSETSNNKSKGITEQLISKVLDATNEAGITDSHPDDEKLAKAANLINAPLRKVAHATVYFVLAIILLILGRVIFGGRKYLLTCAATILLCFLFAMTDEYHQTFVDGRTGQFMDVLIDTAGAYVGTLLSSSYYLAWWIGCKSKTISSHSKTDEITK